MGSDAAWLPGFDDLGYDIEAIHAAASRPDCFHVFGRLIARRGFPAFVHVPVAPATQDPLDAMWATVRPDWVETYQREQFWRTDPVVAASRQTVAPLVWSDMVVGRGLFAGRTLGRPALRVMEAVRDFGYLNGITLPIHGGNRAVISCFAEDASPTACHEMFQRHGATVSLLMLHLHESLARFGRCDEVTGSVEGSITPRMREILTWVAAGKTNAEIAIILGISGETVSSHMRGALARLDVHTRAQAAARALRLGLIRP